MRIEHDFADGDALIHALVDAGGHDPEFLTADQLAAAPLRLPVEDYLSWYATLPEDAARGDGGGVGAASGRPLRRRRRLRDRRARARQRGRGDPAAARLRRRSRGHLPRPGAAADPSLPRLLPLDRPPRGAPTRSCISASTGRSNGRRARCSPSSAVVRARRGARLVPLVYPFVVNDPGEGVQAKRRAHATIVDHLVPPMMRADTYDEIAELEALLDEYARLEVLDPSKLPAWRRGSGRRSRPPTCRPISASTSARDDVGALVEHIDGYLCEVKDIQIKDGLHILGRAPSGEQLRGLVSAMLRLGSGDVPGLRRAVGAAFGLDEPALVAGAGAPAPDVPAVAARALPRPVASAGDLVDRLEARAHGAARRAGGARLGPGAAAGAARRPRLLDDGVERVLRFARRRSCRGSCARPTSSTPSSRPARPPCAGRARPARRRAAGSRAPDRAQLLLASTPGRCRPSCPGRSAGGSPTRCSTATSTRPASCPGWSAWWRGAPRPCAPRATTWRRSSRCSASGPTWHPESARVTGIEVIPLAELGRPRIDVTVRISGFFRDAFPHLVALLDDAVAAVAALDEPDADNFVAAHARADAERLAGELGREPRGGGRRPGSSARSPGHTAPGCCSCSTPATGATTPTSPRSTRPGAAMPTAAGSTARRRGRDARLLRADRRRGQERRLSRARHPRLRRLLPVPRRHGGDRPRAHRHEPAAYLGDSSRPSRVVARTLAEETRRVFRARVANPRWIASTRSSAGSPPERGTRGASPRPACARRPARGPRSPRGRRRARARGCADRGDHAAVILVVVVGVEDVVLARVDVLDRDLDAGVGVAHRLRGRRRRGRAVGVAAPRLVDRGEVAVVAPVAAVDELEQAGPVRPRLRPEDARRRAPPRGCAPSSPASRSASARAWAATRLSAADSSSAATAATASSRRSRGAGTRRGRTRRSAR